MVKQGGDAQMCRVQRDTLLESQLGGFGFRRRLCNVGKLVSGCGLKEHQSDRFRGRMIMAK